MSTDACPPEGDSRRRTTLRNTLFSCLDYLTSVFLSPRPPCVQITVFSFPRCSRFFVSARETREIVNTNVRLIRRSDLSRTLEASMFPCCGRWPIFPEDRLFCSFLTGEELYDNSSWLFVSDFMGFSKRNRDVCRGGI